MSLQLILVLSAILSIKLVFGYDPTAQVTVTEATIKILPNPYFENWSIEILSPGNILSAKVPMKKDVPETMMMKVSVEFEGSPLPDLDFTLCEVWEDETYGKDVIDKGIPKGKFPTKCPIKAGQDYEVFKYEITNQIVIPGLPDGHFVIEIRYYEPDQDSILFVHFEGDLSHKVPGIPGFGR